MNIAIDIDGVLIDDDNYILDHLSKYLYDNNLPIMSDPIAYEDKFIFTKEHKEKYKKEYLFPYFKNAKPREYAAEVVKKLSSMGNKIFVMTGRYKTTTDLPVGNLVRTLTKKWLKKNKIYYDEILFVKTPKTKEIAQYDIDLIIDDSPEVITEAVKITKVFCFTNPYNINLKNKNLTRVYSWYDLLAKFEMLNKKD